MDKGQATVKEGTVEGVGWWFGGILDNVLTSLTVSVQSDLLLTGWDISSTIVPNETHYCHL